MEVPWEYQVRFFDRFGEPYGREPKPSEEPEKAARAIAL